MAASNSLSIWESVDEIYKNEFLDSEEGIEFSLRFCYIPYEECSDFPYAEHIEGNEEEELFDVVLQHTRGGNEDFYFMQVKSLGEEVILDHNFSDQKDFFSCMKKLVEMYSSYASVKIDASDYAL
jgi:hypothetical protein